ncbi:MAG: Gfo/Idh/MocA family oxidoreductase [Cyanobacteriota bacterium]|nr:Gfo/Idh/MocA family oxidoreductase [Cyanobacteriota bacterium]
MASIRVAVLGTGFGQAVHIPGLRRHPRTEVAALYHRDLEKAKELARRFEIPWACDSLGEILANPQIDAVTLATPPFLHYDQAKQALLARKHILLEKPVTLRAPEARELYHLAQERGLTALCDFEFRFVPAWQALAHYLSQGFAGKLRLVKIDWLVASRANPQRPWNWYAQGEKGGGVLGALGSHSFDYLHWLFGPIAELSAVLSCAIPERPDPLDNNRLKPVTAEDTALISFTLQDGTPGQLALSSVAANGRGHWLEIYGDQGTLVLGSDNLKDYVHGFRLWGAPMGQELQELAIPPAYAFAETFPDGRLAPFIRVLDQWVKGIESGVSSAPSLREGVYSQLLMDLAQQSHQLRRALSVPDLDDYLTP